ncbi:MAG: putative repeat protein family [Pseudonocardiales bacterium]|nr:putative repeat protein family [Pseudonocardiales bacterium]
MTPEELTPPVELDVEDALELLRQGELTVEGRLVDASNATLYCAISHDGLAAACVYKPVAGERPLWDFPDGTLAEREVAAYEVSAASGWRIVPPTVYRDGPLGPGMVQLWIAEDPSTDVIRLIRRRDSAALRRIAVFDAVINNADRKGGHLLPTPDGHVYGVDHGVSFHSEDKLRTVLWQWAGNRLAGDALETLRCLRAQLDGPLCDRLGELLTTRELRRTVRRVERLIASGRHPEPSDDWPAVPWPPM